MLQKVLVFNFYPGAGWFIPHLLVPIKNTDSISIDGVKLHRRLRISVSQLSPRVDQSLPQSIVGAPLLQVMYWFITSIDTVWITAK